MRALLQRVTRASVVVGSDEISAIDGGWLVFLGVAKGDAPADAANLARKVAELRCFADDAGKTNLSAEDVGAEILLVSQFTLVADTSRGRRPSFAGAAPPEEATVLIGLFAQYLGDRGFNVKQGVFGAHMRVTLTNDGPFTIWLDTTAA